MNIEKTKEYVPNNVSAGVKLHTELRESMHSRKMSCWLEWAGGK